MIKYKSIRDPILYLVDEYFKNKNFARLQHESKKNSEGLNINTDSIPNRDNLPEYPVLFILDENENYVRAIYGNYEYLGENIEVDIRIWQEEFIYDDEGDCIEIKITYPDGDVYSLTVKYDVQKYPVEIK